MCRVTWCKIPASLQASFVHLFYYASHIVVVGYFKYFLEVLGSTEVRDIFEGLLLLHPPQITCNYNESPYHIQIDEPAILRKLFPVPVLSREESVTSTIDIQMQFNYASLVLPVSAWKTPHIYNTTKWQSVIATTHHRTYPGRHLPGCPWDVEWVGPEGT